jgi:hypothetical protein
VTKSKSEGGSSYDPVPVAVGTYVALNVMEGKSPLAWDGDNAAKAVVGAAAAPFVGMAILGAGIAALGGVYLTAKGQWDSWFGKNPDLKAVPEKDVRLASAEKDIKTMYKKNPALKPSGL